MVLGCQQNVKPNQVSVFGWADTDPSWDSAGTEGRIDLHVGDFKELGDSVPDVRYCNDKGKG